MAEPEKPWVHKWTPRSELPLIAECSFDLKSVDVSRISPDWRYVTCPACRELEPRENGVAVGA